MFASPELAVQLAREHQRQLQADASQQRHRPRRPEPGIPDTAAKILRGLTAALTRAGVAAPRHPAPAGQPAGTWPTNQPSRPHATPQPPTAP